MKAKHIATDRDRKPSTKVIYWFDLNSDLYGVLEINGERLVIDGDNNSVPPSLFNPTLADFTITKEMQSTKYRNLLEVK